MATLRLSSREKRALILWVLAGIVGLWYAQRHFFEAFPEASVNFKVPREEALRRAKSFVESLGQDVSGYRSVIVFGVNDNAKTYLEREVGLKEANRMMSSEVNVWNWDVRFFRPNQEEEFRVAVSPQGNISGYVHKVPEARAGGDPKRTDAAKTAQDFLMAKLGKNGADWDLEIGAITEVAATLLLIALLASWLLPSFLGGSSNEAVSSGGSAGA